MDEVTTVAQPARSVICAWCRTMITEGRERREPTHGMCKDCEALDDAARDMLVMKRPRPLFEDAFNRRRNGDR